MEPIDVRAESTPNPNARRFVLNRPVQEHPRGRFFTDAGGGEEPLVRLLFEVSGVSSVMLLPTSVTVNKEPAAQWDVVEAATVRAIESFFS
jgi:hypothetical protein